MRSINLMVACAALFALSGCATMNDAVRRAAQVGGPPVIVRGEANEYGVRGFVQFDIPTFLSTRSGPRLLFQNQAGGWEPIYDGGWINLPINQYGLTFNIIPNGHFVGYDATLDGVPIGGGANLFFGFGTGTHDGGKHLLVVNVQRRFSPDLGDPVPEEFTDTRTFKVIIFYRATW